MRHNRFFGLALIAAVLPAACQPLPKPFSPVGAPENALLALPDYAGIVVLPVAEAPPMTADALTLAMVAALQAANVPATTGGGNRASRFLQGRVEDDGRDPGLIWELFAPDGTSIGEYRHSIEGVPLAAWRAAEPALMQDLAAAGAPPIAALLQPRAIQRAAPIYLADAVVSGAPGHGDAQLERAILAALQARGVVIATPPPPTGVAANSRLEASVELDPARGGTQQVRVTWAVLAADGTELGVVAQQNEVPAGSLDDSWAAVAPLIASAAAPGIIEVLRQNRPTSDKSAITVYTNQTR